MRFFRTYEAFADGFEIEVCDSQGNARLGNSKLRNVRYD